VDGSCASVRGKRRGKVGGKRSLETMTPEQRTERSKRPQPQAYSQSALRHPALAKMAEAGILESTMEALSDHMITAKIERYSRIRMAAS
jgi:hypothetical protein